MAIIKTSLEASTHSICAEIVQREMYAFENKSLASCITVPALALAVRVIAVASHALWMVHETVNFLPRILRIGYGILETDQSPSPQAFQKAGQIYGLYLKTLGAQFVTGTLGAVLPEVAYGRLELQKPLFGLQLEAFLLTLPDLPHVQKHVRAAYPLIGSLVELYTRLGCTNSQWKKALHRTIKKISDFDPIQAAGFLTTKTKLFQEAFHTALASLVCERLNQLQREGKFDKAWVERVHPGVWMTIHGFMLDETKEQLIRHLREVIPNAENDNYYIHLHKQLVTEYRTPDALLACRLLFEKMNEAKRELVAKNIFTIDDIGYMIGQSYEALIMLAIYRFIDSAEMDANSKLTFRAQDGKRCTFSRSMQFFGEKGAMTEAKEKLRAASNKEIDDLFNLICGKEVKGASARVRECYNLFQGIKTRTVDRKISSEKSIPWADVFN